MADVLLTLIMPDDVAEHVQDLLLTRPDLVPGFTSTKAEGRGAAVMLVADTELVVGHSPRTAIRTVGPETAKREVLALLKRELPHANIFYWMTPVIESGHV